MSTEQKMRQLENSIRKHQQLYYIQNQPKISDLSFDTLLTELKQLEEQHPELASENSPTQLVGSDVSNVFSKYRHSIPVHSLSNSYSIQETLAWAQKILNNEKVKQKGLEQSLFQVQWKMDGATLVLYYEKGELKHAVTRGTGSIGDDVTTNARTIRNIPQILQEPWTLAVRGEVYMRYKDFIDYNQCFGMAYANPRNLVAGSLKHKDSREVAKRPLLWTAFDATIISKNIHNTKKDKGETSFLHAQELLKTLEHLGLPTGISSISIPFTSLEQTMQQFSQKKASLGFPVDGLVIKINDLTLRSQLGHTSHAPRWAIAYKFKPELVETTVEAIEVLWGELDELHLVPP